LPSPFPPDSSPSRAPQMQGPRLYQI
jgi:hypothetical protein